MFNIILLKTAFFSYESRCGQHYGIYGIVAMMIQDSDELRHPNRKQRTYACLLQTQLYVETVGKENAVALNPLFICLADT